MTVARPRTSAPRRRPPTPRLGRVGTRGGRAAFLGTGPAAWYDTRDLLTTTQQTLTNRVGTSTVTLGSTGGSDTNDPVAFVHSGTNYVYLPGAVDNRIHITQAGILSTGGPGVGVCGRTEWDMESTGANQRWVSFGNNIILDITSTRTMSINWRDSGGSFQTTLTSTAALPADFYTAGIRYQLGFEITGTNTASFYYRTGGQALGTAAPGSWSGWTLLEAVTGSGRSFSASWTNTSLIDLSSNVNANLWCKGRFYGASMWAASPATEFRVVPSVDTIGQTGWTSASGHTVVIARSTSGLTTAVVIRPLLMADGTDDYVQLPAGDTPTFTATTGAYTVMLINRVHNLAGAATLSRVWSSESAADNGAHIYLDQTSAQYKVLVGGATTTATTAAVAFTQTTQLHAVAAVFDNGTAYAYSTTTGLTAGVDTTGVGTITHASAPRVGSRADSVASPADFQNNVVVHWTRALTATELATAATYLTGTYS